MKLKVLMVLDVNMEEYPIPSDGDVMPEIEDALREYLHDVSGVAVSSLKMDMER
tara:strand:+ start:7561 stop:7722 length:162 start_codon:yes stop_codon:yes gene_type:complete